MFRNFYSSLTEEFYACWTNLFTALVLYVFFYPLYFTNIILVCDRCGGAWRNSSFSTENLRSSGLGSSHLAWEEKEAVSILLDRWARIELAVIQIAMHIKDENSSRVSTNPSTCNWHSQFPLQITLSSPVACWMLADIGLLFWTPLCSTSSSHSY